jgi:hypothetical protein
MRVRVVDGTQVHHDGVTYDAGQGLDVADDIAAPWLASGWVEVAVEAKPVKASRVSRKRS